MISCAEERILFAWRIYEDTDCSRVKTGPGDQLNECTNGHWIDDTNESYAGIICVICVETSGTESDFEIDWPIDDYDSIADALDSAA